MTKRKQSDLVRRTRAAVAYVNTSNDAGVEMAAFMALFHPDAPREQTQALVQAARSKQRERR